MSSIKIKGELEIDSERGVIYFHTSDLEVLEKNQGQSTILRICHLPKPIPTSMMLDITHMMGCNWSGEKNCPVCNGRGTKLVQSFASASKQITQTCGECKGTGSLHRKVGG